MERPPVFDTQKVEPDLITPEHVRGLSLGKVTEQFGTAGLYIRTIDTLERAGLGDNELVQLSLQLGLTLHADDYRTNGHYSDHLMRVTLRMVEDFNICDPSLVAAGPLHDVLEDHPRDLVLALTGEKPSERDVARQLGYRALAELTNDRVAHIVKAVTNPIIEMGQDKLKVYADHTRELVLHSPEGRVLKLADFIDNAAGNHATRGDKQLKLDEKYINQYRFHRMGLFLPDSIITGKERTTALHLLSKGHARALGRLAAKKHFAGDPQMKAVG